MPLIQSKIQTDAKEFLSNDKANRELADELRKTLAEVATGGPERSREKHLARGKLLPRERVNKLLDDGTPFLEIAPLAAWGQYDDEVPAAGIIAGIGQVAGVDCVIVANGRNGQGRHLLSADGQKASAGARDRGTKWSAVYLPCRLGGCIPANARRGVPRSRAFRPHIF